MISLQRHSEKGFTLLEVMIALSIFSIVMISMISFIPNTISLTKNNQLKYEAVNKIMDIELDLQERRIVPEFAPGWKWEKEALPFHYTVSYLREDGLYHVFKITVRWETVWMGTQKVTSQTIVKR
jgi:prepilin-type N-terminal cleavage/methylation domain-containing protein